MKRADFLRLSGLGTFGLLTDSFALPEGYTGIPAGIRPYLQTPRPDSMWVSWFSDDATTGSVEWGTAAGSLSNTVPAALDVLGPGYHYHSARLSFPFPNASTLPGRWSAPPLRAAPAMPRTGSGFTPLEKIPAPMVPR